MSSATYVPTQDAMVFDGGGAGGAALSDAWALEWGTPLVPVATPPGDLVWSPGGSVPTSYHVANPFSFSQPVDYELTSARSWPGYPVTGTTSVPASGAVDIPISVPAPDTVSPGLNTLTFRATLRSVPVSVSCTNHIHDATTATIVSLRSAAVESGVVHLRWDAPGGDVRVATVHRRTPATGWSPIARITADGVGGLAFDDTAVNPGGRYGYRLDVATASGPESVGEAWVDVPATGELALANAGGNPTAGPLSVRFTLAGPAPARLEVLDVSGRRVAMRQIDGGASSDVSLALDETRSLPAGVYLVRLQQGREARTVRIVRME